MMKNGFIIFLLLFSIFGGVFLSLSTGQKVVGNFGDCYFNDKPIAELNGYSLKEVFKEENSVLGVGKNLFDKSIITLGFYVRQQDGELRVSESTDVSEYILVNENTNYYLSNYNEIVNRDISFYDYNKNFISGIGTTNDNLLFTTPFETAYVRFSVAKTKVDIAQLEQGTVATTYEPYKSTLNNDDGPFVHWFGLDDLGISPSIDMDYWYNEYIENENVLIPCPYVHQTDNTLDIDGSTFNNVVKDTFLVLQNPLRFVTNLGKEGLNGAFVLTKEFGLSLFASIQDGHSFASDDDLLASNFSRVYYTDWRQSLTNDAKYKKFLGFNYYDTRISDYWYSNGIKLELVYMENIDGYFLITDGNVSLTYLNEETVVTYVINYLGGV